MNDQDLFQRRPIRRVDSGEGRARYVAGQLIVKLKSQFSYDPKAQMGVLRALPKGTTLQRGFDELGMAVINLPNTSDLFEVIRKLNDQDVIEFAEPNFLDSGS